MKYCKNVPYVSDYLNLLVIYTLPPFELIYILFNFKQSYYPFIILCFWDVIIIPIKDYTVPFLLQEIERFENIQSGVSLLNNLMVYATSHVMSALWSVALCQ